MKSFLSKWLKCERLLNTPVTVLTFDKSNAKQWEN